MPPRKSNTSQVTAATTDETTPGKERDGINIEDLSLPRTMVQRLAKGVLPSNTQIQKDALTAMSKAATVFVNYLSQAANTTAAYSTRKTIAPEAVLDALDEIEFADFVPRVQAELKRFNEVQTGKRNEYRRKLKEKEADKGDGAGITRDGEERAAKRVRRSGAPAATATATTTTSSRVSIGTSGAVRETRREKEDPMDQETEEQPEDLDVTATEEFDAEPETGGADEEGTEAEQEAEDEDEENNDDDGDEDEEDADEDSSGGEQNDIDVDDADLRERAVGRGRRGEAIDDDDDDEDVDDGTSSGSEAGSGTEGDSGE